MTATPEDVLHGDWDADAWWSTTNFGEAIPGVLTPLNWSFWAEPGERAARRAFAATGAMSAEETRLPPDPKDRAFAIFHGRFACKVDFMGELGDRLPGTSGAAVAEQILGEVPPGFASRNTLRRLPAVARRLPVLFLALPGRVNAQHAETATWWTAEIERVASLDLDAARAQWRAASARFEDVASVHVSCLLAAVQPVFEQVQRLALAAGDVELAARATTGQGSHAELAMVEDLWRLSREQLTVVSFLARHGYHGPAEGEIASRVWREDAGPVVAMARGYAARPEAESPAAAARRQALARTEARAAIVARLPRRRRPQARLVLALADRYLPLRGVGKVSFLKTLDVARAASRRIGEHLAAGGVLEDPDDAFYLTSDELLTAAPDARLAPLVATRRAQRAAHEALVLPGSWRGHPDTRPAVTAPDADRPPEIRLEGVGASPGIVEASVRVVMDPSFDEVQPGEILVAPTTDPSWASIMFMSAALVVDLGGQLSHAAVVARELGVPCVMGTGDGTRRLRTGDVCRVDGHAGTVEVLVPVASGSP